jgi:predicted Zn-dependent protease
MTLFTHRLRTLFCLSFRRKPESASLPMSSTYRNIFFYLSFRSAAEESASLPMLSKRTSLFCLSFRRKPESASLPMPFTHQRTGCPIFAAVSSRLRWASTQSVDRLLLLTAFFALSLPAQAQNLPAGTRPPDSTRETTPLAQAEDAIANQRFDEAKSKLLTITANEKNNARALYDLGYTEEALHDDTAAETTYRAAIAADPKSFEAHAALGMLLLQKDPTGARKELLAALPLTPAANIPAAKASVLRELANLDATVNPAVASDELLAAIHLTGETPQDTLLTAQIAEKLSDLPDAEATYRRVLAASPNDPDAAYALTGLLIREDKLADAEPVLTEALKAHPDDAPLTAQLARVYALQGADDKALPLLEQQHTQHPQNTATTRMLADAYNRTDNAAKADILYQSLLATSPDDIGLLTARGDSLIRQKKFAQAQDLLQHADALFLARPAILPANDDRVQLTGSLAFAASENNEPAIVLTALDQRALYAAETPATLFLRATAHDHLHHLALAKSFYTQFLATAGDKYPDETWEAKHRLVTLAHAK